MVSGSRIKMLRESQGLSAVELAQRIGKNKATVIVTKTARLMA